MDPRPPAPPAAPVVTGDWGTAPPRPREPQPGEQIGPYRLVRQIGRGGMAVVFEADDTELPRRVALKVLVDTDPQAKLRFVREAHAQAKVTHDNVVTIYRVGEDRGVSYIAMPVLAGQSLAQALVATPKPPLAHVVRIGQEIAEGLSAAHAAGLIHRDIKPANIWLEAPKWRVKILDFGLVRDPHANTQIDITMQGHVVGTPAYMSPEQAAGQEVDRRTDLWSLGVVLYQMTTGKRPFNDDNTVNLMTAIVSQEAAAPVDLAPDLPPKLSDLIRRLMAKHPPRRPATAAAVAAELDAIGKALVAPPVVVVSLPAAVPEGQPSGVSPWNDLEATQADLSRAAPPAVTRPATEEDGSYDRPPPPRRPRPKAKAAGVPKWAWIAGGVFAAVLAVGTLVLALNPFGEKTIPTEPTVQEQPRDRPAPPPARPPAPRPDPVLERQGAAALTPFARLKLSLEDGAREVEVNPRAPLPPGRFTVTGVDFGSNTGIGDAFMSGVFLPQIAANLRGLVEVRSEWGGAELTLDHLRRLAGTPAADSLQVLRVAVDLTPESVTELKKFRNLSEVVFKSQAPADATLAAVKGLPRVRRLTLFQFARSQALTRAGWDAVAAMPLEHLTLWDARGAPDALRALAARGGPYPVLEFVRCHDLTDAALVEHLKPTADVWKMEFRYVDLTDNGLMTLAAVHKLKDLTLVGTKVDVRRAIAVVQQSRPDLKIHFDPRK